MAISAQAQQFAAHLEGMRGRLDGLDLATTRDVVEAGFQSSGAEPEGVSYAEIDAGGVPAIWCIPAGADEQHALVHFHNGGAVVASAASDRKGAAHLAKAAGVRSLVVDFRRAPEHKHPAQLDDAERAFTWLAGQGYEPSKIASTGHSIGGYLAIALALRLRDQGKPLPAAVVSVSPWADLTLSSETIDGNAGTDKMLARPILELFREGWLGGTGLDWADPQVSLVNADLSGLPPTYLSFGEYELLNGEDKALGQRLAECGVDTEVREVPGGQHSFIIAGGRVPEVDAAIASIGAWLRGKLNISGH